MPNELAKVPAANVPATAAWTLSMMVGSHRAASDWIDRLRRLIGLYWLMSVPGLGWVQSG